MKYVIKVNKSNKEEAWEILNKLQSDIKTIINGPFSLTLRDRSILIETSTTYPLNLLSNLLEKKLPPTVKIPFWS